MVERKSILSQRMWVGKRILAMCKNEAFLKIGQFIEMPCLTCCNRNGCSDFVFWRQNVLRRMCHITSQVWGFLFKRNKHPSGISCQMSVQVFVCVFWSMTCKLLHQNTSLFLTYLRKIGVECGTNFHRSNLWKCIGKLINIYISYKTKTKLASTTSSLAKLMKTFCIVYGGNSRSLWLSVAQELLNSTFRHLKTTHFPSVVGFVEVSCCGQGEGGRKQKNHKAPKWRK